MSRTMEISSKTIECVVRSCMPMIFHRAVVDLGHAGPGGRIGHGQQAAGEQHRTYQAERAGE